MRTLVTIYSINNLELSIPPCYLTEVTHTYFEHPLESQSIFQTPVLDCFELITAVIRFGFEMFGISTVYAKLCLLLYIDGTYVRCARI